MDPDDVVCSPLDLEGMITDERAEPRYLRISLLESITNNFANDLTIGSGGFSVVYMGLLQNCKVAVKHLTQTVGVHETTFKQEVDCLMSVKHKNIVRFLGYCSDIQQKMGKVEGKSELLEDQKRFLCFEYLPWSLDKYIKDPQGGDEWKTCYNIIKGICEGLHYLHQQKIVHLDLKPANILLDHNMVPKITDFGISKRFDEQQTHLIMTSNLCGSLGYIAPEIFRGKITFKSDIYSLGIIIVEILTGNKGYMDIDSVIEIWSIKFGKLPRDTQLEPVRVCAKIGMECTAFNPAERPDIRQILEMLYEMESAYGASRLVDEVEPLLVSETSMGLEVTSTDVHMSKHACDAKSSVISDLVDELSSMGVAAAPFQPLQISSVPDRPNEASTEATCSSVSSAPSPLQRITGVLQGSGGTSRKILSDRSSEISKLLDVSPLELRFPWEPNQEDVKCLVTMTNRTDRYVCVWITPSYEDNRCFTFVGGMKSEKDFAHIFEDDINKSAPYWQVTMKPHSTVAVALKMKAQPKPPPVTMFEVLMVLTGSNETPEKFLLYYAQSPEKLVSSNRSKFNLDTKFLKRVEKLGGQVHGAMLMAVTCDPAGYQGQIVTHNELKIPVPSEFKEIDVHPTETWILALHLDHDVSIFNYETQKVEMVLQSETVEIFNNGYLVSAKFIAQEQWFAVGDNYGCVHVYSYTTKQKVMEFETCHGRYFNCGLELAVHPTSPYLLTATSNDNSIKLWDWSKGWKCTRKFDASGICYVRWNPMDGDTFINVSHRSVQIWSIYSSDPIAETKRSYGALVTGCCLYSDGNQMFMVILEDFCAKVWDMQKKNFVHELVVNKGFIRHVASHPMLPILLTVWLDTFVCVWDARTYRLLKMVDIGDVISRMVLIRANDSARLIVLCGGGLSSMEINFPTLDMTEPQSNGPE